MLYSKIYNFFIFSVINHLHILHTYCFQVIFEVNQLTGSWPVTSFMGSLRGQLAVEVVMEAEIVIMAHHLVVEEAGIEVMETIVLLLILLVLAQHDSSAII